MKKKKSHVSECPVTGATQKKNSKKKIGIGLAKKKILPLRVTAHGAHGVGRVILVYFAVVFIMRARTIRVVSAGKLIK